MKRICLALALAGGIALPRIGSAQFADEVISYNSGTGFAAGYTNASAALGAPTPGSSVTPFAPPFGKSQIVSVGTNGSLTLGFNPPIINNPSDPFGLDFIIFGNSFFTITNGDYSGGGITSGEIGGNNPGMTRVEVSADGVSWFTLDPLLAPTVDGKFPTDGPGDPGIPANPSLTGSDFAGMDLAGIRSLYKGSAGGTGFDLAWAQDTNGNPVNIPMVRYLRINVLSGKSEIDALSEVRGQFPCIAEDFVTNPFQDGWNVFGDTNLFAWDSTNENLSVTWDSSQANSYFYHPLGTILASNDDFSVQFDLTLSDASVTGTFQVAVGLLNFSDATKADFSRPAGSTPNLFEFDYFPDGGYGPTVAATLTDTNVSATNTSDFYFAYDAVPLADGVTYHVILTHVAGEPTMSGEVLTNGQIYTSLPSVYAGPISDFRLDTVAISSYSAAGDTFGDSLLAHGTVDNLVITLPSPPIQNLTGLLSNGTWQAQFTSRDGWIYTLQRTADFQAWTNVSLATPGNGTDLFLPDLSPPMDKAFYRVDATRP